MTWYWVCLLLAGMLEWGWPLGLKLGRTESGWCFWPLLLAAVSMTGSGVLLLVAQTRIPIGTAYAVWTGIGAIGTFVIGIVVFGDPAHWQRFTAAGMIIGGIVLMKLAHT